MFSLKAGRLGTLKGLAQNRVIPSSCMASIGVRPMSRFSANNIMSGSDIFRLADYDCIGFDLDSTLCHYNITNNVKLVYNILARYLVEMKKYDPVLLYLPIDNDLDYLQKGLILDMKRGNILKLDDDGLVNKVCHGLRMLSEEEIVSEYGSDKEWDCAMDYSTDMLRAWNGPRSEEIRALLDYYDVASALCFSRCVETVNRQGLKRGDSYSIWPDILDGLMYMFAREHYAIDKGDYFPALKKSPELYYYKSDPAVVQWLKELRHQKKLTFVVTGSNVDYANHTGTYCLGPQWNELFDVVIYYSRKPGFFVGNRPFYIIKDNKEIKPINESEIRLQNGVGYSQGNWNALYRAFKKHLNLDNPKCVYFGDNLLQDVFTPSDSKLCDTVAINEEMHAEGILNHSIAHPDAAVLNSVNWGSYFHVEDVAGVKIPSMWGNIIRKHSKICIPNLSVVSKLPIDHEFLTFSENKFCKEGFYPGPPLSIV